MNKYFVIALLLLSSAHTIFSQPLKPFGALPTQDQLAWHDMQYYMFIHFGPNTFTNKEWGHGNEDPKVFNPSALDCRQWVSVARQAGMKGIIITAKHHDGFCLWPSKFSTHTVRESAWKDGQGDVLKELSDACREQGMKFGVYLSPWDRNHPDYGTDRYNEIFVKMLGEVLSNYGNVFEQWFDGANGEGPNGKKQVYDWKLFNGTVYKYQPDAIIFSDGGPGCRWVGNEKGFAGETNWCTLNVESVYPGYPNAEELTLGHEGGTTWVPAECDVSIRPGWFYSPDTDGKVKTVKQLKEIYYASIGRGGNLLLNVPVDRRGLIAKEDSVRLLEFRKSMDSDFNINLAGGMQAEAVTGSGFKATNLNDGNQVTLWTTPENISKADIIFKSKKSVTFNRIVIEEDIASGQRIKSFSIETETGNHYVEIAKATTVGNKRIIRIPVTTTKQLRISIKESKARPALREIGIYLAKDDQ